MQENSKNRPIFIVGCERSGTTMLRLILCSHKNIAIPPQTKYIKKLYKRRFLFGDLSKPKNRSKLNEWFYNNHDKKTKIVDLEINKTDIQNSLKTAGNSLGAFLAVIPKMYSEKFGKVRWGDKHPYYIKYLSQLYNLFPDAQVIHIIRDGRDSIASLKKMPWWKKGSMFAMLNWQEAIRRGVKAKNIYSAEQFMEIRYEDIISNPKESVKTICGFLKEEYSDSLLKFNKLADASIPSYKMDWHSRTKEKINSNSIGRWENDLIDWEIALINRNLKKELTLYKYALNNNNIKIPFIINLKYFITKIQYKYIQYGTQTIDKLMSLLYRWDMDHRI